MGRVVACHHCGAPHRPARAQSRFVCEWCGGENVHRDGEGAVQGVEELVVDAWPDADLARTRVDAALRRRGVTSPRVVAGPPRWLARWQVVGENGETFERSAHRGDSRLDAALELPTARSVPADAIVPGGPFEARRPADVDVDEIVSAARAGFSDPAQPVAALRLVWVPVCDARVHTPGGTVDALYVGGADEVVVGPLPPRAADPPAESSRLLVYLAFVATAFGAGVLVDDPWGRLLVLTPLVLAALLTQFVPRRGGRNS